MFFDFCLAFEMDGDRRVMYDGWRKDGAHSNEWMGVTKAFLEHAFKDATGRLVKCPCNRCENKWPQKKEEMEKHLCKSGFMPNYLVWYRHGESIRHVDAEVELDDDHDRMDDMLHDLGREVEMNAVEPGQLPRDAQEFFRLLAAGEERLHEHTQMSVLGTLTRLMAIKSKHNISNSAYNDIVQLMGEVLPENHKLPKNMYFAKKMLAGLGMTYEKIDVCPNSCMLFFEEDDKLDRCKHCEASRYVEVTNDEGELVVTKVAAKQLRRLPIIPRLSRLFLNKEIALHMTWPKNGVRLVTDPDIMVHPSDGDAWKAFDEFDPEFANDPRSVRLGLSTDGFTPFNTSASPYSCWPVFIVPYNLPPELVNKEEFMFLALVIPGPEHPGPKLNMFVRPLIEELKQLWRGVKAYDSHTEKEFTMRAAYLWSVHDLLAYGDWSGWCVHGRLCCPICMNDTDAFRLKHGGKVSFFDAHRRWTPFKHDFRNSLTAFRSGAKIRNGPPKRQTAPQIMAWHACLKQGENDRFQGYGEDHNWTHISSIWELPYAKALIMPHNIDLMHQERNVAESIISTCFDVTDKTKDNMKARKDMAEICKRPMLELKVSDKGHESRPRADYCLKPDERKEIFKWLKNLKFPDRYAANLKRAVNLKTGKLIGLKSHDYHIIMERLMPVMFRGYFKDELWSIFAELSYFYREVCAKTVSKRLMQKFEKEIPILICKFEKVFPPGFFNVMQHLIVHLPWEALVGGPVQFRWMYPIERALKKLRASVRNKARVEGCIAEAFALKEISQFSTRYFARANNVFAPSVRLHVDNESPQSTLQIFANPGKAVGKGSVRHIEASDLNTLMLYMYSNIDSTQEAFE